MPMGPRAQPRHLEFELHGRTWSDPFEWLRADPAPLLQAEGVYAEGALSRLAAVADGLIEQTREEVLSGEFGIPQRQGGWWFLPDMKPGAKYPRIVRVPAAGVAPPNTAALRDEDMRVVLDLNEVLADAPASVGGVHLSPCERYVAWSEDSLGDEVYHIRVREVATGQEIATRISRATSRIVFSKDGSHFLSINLDEKNRPFRVTRHETVHPDNYEVVLEELDERFRIRMSRSSSSDFVFISATGADGSKNYFLRSNQSASQLRIIPGINSDETAICSHLRYSDRDSLLLVITSPQRPNGTLVEVPLDPDGDRAQARSRWVTVIPHSDERRLSTALPLRDFVLIGTREAGRDTMWVARSDTFGDGHVAFDPISPWADADARLAMTPEWDSSEVLVTRASFVSRQAIYQVQLAQTDEAVPIKIGASTEQDVYVEERIFAATDDDEMIPITIVRRRDFTGPRPVILTGYGAYDVSFERQYNPLILRLLDTGIVYAVAHVRGGGEKGARWHDAARRLGKPLSFTDFLTSRQELVDRGIANPRRVVAIGASAGGLLVAASLNRDPTSFCGVVADVPFVDPLTTMMKPELPLTISDRKEWGDPLADPEIAACIQDYSPYHNIRAVNYPPVLALCGLNDTRVMPIEALKWVQRLRTEASGGGPFLLYVKPGGHLGGISIDDSMRHLAIQYAWAAERLGVNAEDLLSGP